MGYRLLCWIVCVGLAHQVTDVLADSGYFWHVTDFHYDYTYHDRQLSCNPDKRPSSPGQYGDFWCDSPWALINNSVWAMADIKPDADFLIWTGDTVLHASDDHTNYSINSDIMDNVTNALKTAFPGKSVYATFGNHDYWPHNQFPGHNDRIYNDTLDRWRDWINDASQDNNFRQGGFYSVKINSKLRLVALNTNLYYTSNKAVIGDEDPAGQLQWLEDTLQDADNNDEKVLVIGHIPPGIHTPSSLVWMHEQYHDKLVATFMKYYFIIRAMHFGHDHSDGFKILRSFPLGPPAVPIFIAPSVTPWRYRIPNKIGPAHNPGIRLVKYDRETGTHLSIEQYYLDLIEANKDGTATWKLEYNTSDAYNLTVVTGSKLYQLHLKMEDGESEEFKKYWKFYTVSPPAELLEPCDETCHASIVCGFWEFNMKDFNSCKSKMISAVSSVHTSGVGIIVSVMLAIWNFVR